MTTTFHRPRRAKAMSRMPKTTLGVTPRYQLERSLKGQRKKHLSRKCKGGIYLEGEASPAHGSPDKANDAEELVPALNPDEEKKRADDLWSDFLRDVEPNPRKRTVPAASVVSMPPSLTPLCPTLLLAHPFRMLALYIQTQRSTMKRTGKTVPPAQLQNLAMLVKRLLCNMPNRLRRVPRDQGRGV
ncbi:uncharacterized protein LOC119187124 isoform X4 [Rhipicephalus microplus]|uniref:uncharacterized protein LOC119187124 isoform X4 n=1 Tax=Rhipicephalus microplus TaxID=6941 RepID=UPI003F6ABA59